MKSSAYSPLFHRHSLTYMDQPLLFLKENLNINPPINKEEFTRCFCLHHWHKNVTYLAAIKIKSTMNYQHFTIRKRKSKICIRENKFMQKLI